MLARRSLRSSPLIVLGLLLAHAVSSAERAEFLSPPDGAVLIGPTEFHFRVEPERPEVDRIDVYVAGHLVGSALPPNWSFSWDAPRNTGEAKILAVVYSANQVLEKITRQSSSVRFGEEITVSTVQLYPVVRDRKGHYVNDMNRSQFRVYDMGAPAEIEYFNRDVATLNLALLLDTSNSMRRELTSVQQAASRLLDQLESEDVVTVYGFDHSIAQVSPPTTERSKARKGIYELKAGGGTALYDALFRVLQDLDSLSGRKAIALFSDGIDERSITPLRAVVELARKKEVLVYAIGTLRTDDAGRSRRDLVQLAEETGGQLFILDDFKRLPRVFDEILDDLRSQYIISFKPRDDVPNGWRRVDVKVEDPNLSVRHRGQYYYDAESEAPE